MGHSSPPNVLHDEEREANSPRMMSSCKRGRRGGRDGEVQLGSLELDGDGAKVA